jgi:hypothetical protein
MKRCIVVSFVLAVSLGASILAPSQTVKPAPESKAPTKQAELPAIQQGVDKKDPVQSALTELETVKLENVNIAADDLEQTYRIKEYKEQLNQLRSKYNLLVASINKAHPGFVFDAEKGVLVEAKKPEPKK